VNLHGDIRTCLPLNQERIWKAIDRWKRIVALLLLIGSTEASAQTPTFPYQGRLQDGGTAANGNHDLQFALWDSMSGGTQPGAMQTVPKVLIITVCTNIYPKERRS
jgi:hypothetical protein